MKVLLTNFHGDHNLGLFGKATDKICILGDFILEKTRKKIEETLKVKTIGLSISNTNLVGMFCCFNSNGILLPKIATEMEIKKWKEVARNLGLNLEILNSKFTTLGNLILCNDKGAIVSKLLKKEEKKIKDCLDVEIKYSKIGNISVVGACGIATNKGCLLHRDAKEEEIEAVQEVLKVEVDIGTANFGSPFVGACGFANSNGAIVGESTTGPEVARLMEVLSLL